MLYHPLNQLAYTAFFIVTILTQMAKSIFAIYRNSSKHLFTNNNRINDHILDHKRPEIGAHAFVHATVFEHPPLRSQTQLYE
ncbi:hypothetical protein K502DRAFT_346048 [Neoconidiobolus thromboides FSU 785]|nr:hypothetical protein K502DRAFT_346048 [Neoconidiobolus thromboides FSU 785]